MKKCKNCHDYEPGNGCPTCRSEYYKKWSKEKGPGYHKNWRSENVGKVKTIQKRNQLKRKFGITLEQYNNMLEDQNHRCAVCKEIQTQKMLAVDHCHITGRIRGLLCENCNRGIGLLKDSPSILQSAIFYLQGGNHEQSQ